MAGKTQGNDTVKLGMLAKRKRVEPVAGLDASAEYCLVLTGLAMPPNGNCYLARVIDRNHVRLIAYIDRNGHAFATTQPISSPPARTPDLALYHYDEDPKRGEVDVREADGQMHACAFYMQVKELYAYAERPEPGDAELKVPPRQTSALMEYRDFFAHAYLTYVVAPAESTLPGAVGAANDGQPMGPSAPADLLVPLKGNPLPDALGLIASRIDVNIATTPTQVSGFEHFARRVLAECSFEKTRAIVAEHEVRVVKLGTSGSFYLVFDRDIDNESAKQLLAVETAINRIYRVQQALAANGIEGASEQRCFELDERILSSTARRAEKLLADAGNANPWMSLEDGQPARGGEWDVRTRFATALEELPFPLRMEYAFNCHVANGAFAIEFIMPAISQMPQTTPGQGGPIAQTPASLAAMAREYALRTSLALAAAAFASSISIELVSVTVRRMSLEGPADFSLRFSRLEFLGLVPAATKAISEQPLTAPAALNALRTNLQHEADADGAVPWVRLKSDVLAHADRTKDPLEDDRMLPAHIAKRLNAKAVRDLGIIDAKDDPQFQRYEDAVGMIEDAPLLAIATLEEIVNEYEVDHDTVSARFWDSYVTRAILPLVEEADEPPALMAPSYFLALTRLTDLYEDNLEEHEKSLALAKRLIEVAPSISRGYAASDHALVANENYEAAASVLTRALKTATEPSVYTYLYYRLAYALWNTGRTAEAVACYVLVPEDHPTLGALARKELSALMASIHMTEKPGAVDARNALLEAGIPVAPESSIISRLRGLAAELIDEGVFAVALPLLSRSNVILGADPLVAVMRSLL